MATITVASSRSPRFSSAFFTLDDSLPPPGRGGREASFSSYLSAADGSFSLRLSGEFNDHRNANSIAVNFGGSGNRRKIVAATPHDVDELDVFGAEKYFSGCMDAGEAVVVQSETPWKASPPLELEAKLTGPRTCPGTPSIWSEASGNSRSALLRDDGRRNRPTNPLRLPHSGSRKFLGIFPCSCYNGSSVAVDKNGNGSGGGGGNHGNPAGNYSLGAKLQARPELRRYQEGLWRTTDRPNPVAFTTNRDDYLAVAVIKSTVAAKTFQEDQKTARISSIDVSGTPLVGKEASNNSFGRSLTIMSPFSPHTRGCAAAAKDDDACSESSSELFEIESFSTGTAPFRDTRGTSATTTGYEPSEASIEWSVVTASAANFSVASDGEVSPPKRRTNSKPQHQPPGGGLLLGCGSAKAVNVVHSNTWRSHEIKTAGGGGHCSRSTSMDTMMLGIRYRAESPRSADFDGDRAGQMLAPRGIPLPISAHLPHSDHLH